MKQKSRDIYWWCKENLFATPTQGVLSIIAIYLIVWIVWQTFIWGYWQATFFGEDIASCERPGACWAMVTARWEQFIYGFYPVEQRWRVNLAFGIFLTTVLFVAISVCRFKAKILVLVLSLCMITILLMGGVLGTTHCRDR